MRPAFRIHPEAADELDAASAWYDQGGQNRGLAFEADVDAIIDRSLAWPKSAARPAVLGGPALSAADRRGPLDVTVGWRAAGRPSNEQRAHLHE